MKKNTTLWIIGIVVLIFIIQSCELADFQAYFTRTGEVGGDNTPSTFTNNTFSNSTNITEVIEEVIEGVKKPPEMFNLDNLFKAVFDPEARARLFKEGGFVLGIMVFVVIVFIYLSVESKSPMRKRR